MNKNSDFPQYRQLIGRKVYYKIESASVFIEVSWIGEKKQLFRVEAKQYPEMLRVMDMINCMEPYAVLEEFDGDVFL